MDGLLELLDLPLKTAKKAVSGDENEWVKPHPSPSAIDHHLYALKNTAADLALDPLNFVPLGLLAKGLRGTKQLPGAISSLPNYIPNWYGPSGQISEVGQKVADRLAASPKVPLDPSMASAAVQKGEGFGKWLGDSVGSMGRHVASPESRALWSQYGVTKPSQERVESLLDMAAAKGDVNARGVSSKADSRAKEKAVAQTIYESHIAKQTGHVPEETSEFLEELNKRSFVEDYAPATPQAVSEAFQRHKVLGDDGRYYGVSAEEAQFAAQSMLKRQQTRPDDLFVLKAPTAKETGGHHSDVVHKNPMNNQLVKIFKGNADAQGNVSVKALEEGIREGSQALTKEQKRKSGDYWVEGVDPDGVWVSGSKVGSAIVEGGVGWLAKVQPDGTMKVFMNDTHDFFEKTIGLMEKPATVFGGDSVLPTGAVAFTPPMVNNIKSIRKGIDVPLRNADGSVVKDGRKHVKQTLKGPKFTQVGHRGTAKRKGTKTRPASGYTYDELLQGYSGLQPRADLVKREKARMAQQGAGATGLLAAYLGRDDD